jgi:hypothetical protein
MCFRLRKQLAEALGPVNRWYCSQAYRRPVDEPDVLLTYFIKSGGAANFALRYCEAVGPLNRWYCSEFHGREINDPETLWNYYTDCGTSRTWDAHAGKAHDESATLSIAR